MRQSVCKARQKEQQECTASTLESRKEQLERLEAKDNEANKSSDDASLNMNHIEVNNGNKNIVKNFSSHSKLSRKEETRVKRRNTVIIFI